MKAKYYVMVACVAMAVVVSGTLGCRQEPAPRPEVTQEQDEAITRQVRDALDEAEVYKFPDLQVQVRNREVQLSGFVQTTDQRSAAEDIARQVPGVENVINNITVQQ